MAFKGIERIQSMHKCSICNHRPPAGFSAPATRHSFQLGRLQFVWFQFAYSPKQACAPWATNAAAEKGPAGSKQESTLVLVTSESIPLKQKRKHRKLLQPLAMQTLDKNDKSKESATNGRLVDLEMPTPFRVCTCWPGWDGSDEPHYLVFFEIQGSKCWEEIPKKTGNALTYLKYLKWQIAPDICPLSCSTTIGLRACLSQEVASTTSYLTFTKYGPPREHQVRKLLNLRFAPSPKIH